MATILELNVYPIKSCAGVTMASAELHATGLAHDRQWMLIDEHGQFLTQRELPRLALVRTAFKFGNLVITAPGMLRLDLPVDVIEDAPETWRQVKVWNDTVQAVDEGDLCAQWFSDLLGTKTRLVKFHPQARRVCNPKRTGEHEATTLFSDGYPLLVLSKASLDDLNARLAGQGHPQVPMNRFRPNLVVGDIEAYEEDHVDTLSADGVRLKMVKPCTRCNIPNIDQLTAAEGNQPGDTLARYRADARLEGAITFGQNAIVVEGAGGSMRVGQQLAVTLAF